MHKYEVLIPVLVLGRGALDIVQIMGTSVSVGRSLAARFPMFCDYMSHLPRKIIADSNAILNGKKLCTCKVSSDFFMCDTFGPKVPRKVLFQTTNALFVFDQCEG